MQPLTSAVDTSQNGRPWSEVVRRGSRRGQGSQSTRTTRSTNNSHRPRSNGDATTQSETNQENRLTKPSNWMKVAGARKVWGTLKSCTAASVKSAITRVCKNNTLKIKRKNKTVGSAHGIQTQWWYVLHDSEEALVSLESNWEQLALQTSWRLTPCYKPEFDNQEASNTVNHEAAENLTGNDTPSPTSATHEQTAEDSSPSQNNGSSSSTPFLGEPPTSPHAQ